jgi:hypothetical protein
MDDWNETVTYITGTLSTGGGFEKINSIGGIIIIQEIWAKNIVIEYG